MYVAFRTPPVQRYVTGLISEQLSKQLNAKVTLEGIDIEWLDGVELAGVYVEDQQQDTLVYAGLVAAYIKPSALLNSTAYIERVELRDIYVNLYQPEGQQDLNYAFIMESFASEDTTTTPQDTTASSWEIELYRVQLDDIRFDYRADGTEVAMALHELSMLFETLGLDESYIQGDELKIDGLEVALALPAPADSTSTTAVDTTSAPIDQRAAAAASTAADSSNIINPSGFRYALNELVLKNSRLAYRVKGSEDTTLQQINFEDLVVDQLNLEVEDLYVGETEVQLDIPTFTFVESKSGFQLAAFAAEAQVDMPQIAGQLTALETGHSALNGSIALDMTLADRTAELIRSLVVKSELDEAVIGLADAAYFTTALDSFPAAKDLSPRLSWQVAMDNGDGNVEQLVLDIGTDAYLQLNGSFQNVAAAVDTSAAEPLYLDLEIPKLTADLRFIEQFVPPASQQYVPVTNDPALALTASVEGSLEDITAEATLRSGVGNLVADAHYVQQTSYTDVQANVTADNFALDNLLRPFVGDTLANSFGQLSFRTNADVRQRTVPGDTSLQRADVALVVEELAYNDYRYEDLRLSTNVSGDDVEADIRYEDSLLNLVADLKANLADEHYQAAVQLKDANLLRLNLMSDSIIITRAQFAADVQGTDPDELTGVVQLLNTEVVKGRSVYRQDTLALAAQNTTEGRKFSLLADEMAATVSGNFTVAELPAAFTRFQEYYFAASPVTDAQPKESTDEALPQQIDVRLAVEKTPKLAQAFVPSLSIPEPMMMEAAFNSKNHTLVLDVDIPHLEYETYAVDSLLIKAETSERRIKALFQTHYVVASGTSIPDIVLTADLSGTNEEAQENETPLNTLAADLNLRVGQPNAPYHVDLTTRVRSSGDTTRAFVDSLELMLKGNIWRTSDDAQIVYADNYLDINDFKLNQGAQTIAISTKQSDNNSNLELLIEAFQLEPLLASFDLESYGISGTLSGQAEVQNLFVPGAITADFQVAQLSAQDTLLGDLSLEVGKEIPVSDTEDLMNIALGLRGEYNDLRIAGEYNVLAPPDTEALRFDVDLNRLTLGRWEPLAEGVFKELSGTLRADMTVKGTTQNPTIEGDFIFADDVLLTPTMTGARLYIKDQKITFTGDQVNLTEFTLLDSAQTPAVIDGTVDFTDLANPVLDIVFTTEHFQFVSSDEYENEEFYGQALASADLTVTGPAKELNIAGEMVAEEDTDMVIALISGPEEAERAGFIDFVDISAFAKADTVMKDSLRTTAPPEEADTVVLDGYRYAMDILLKVDPEAQFTVVVDPANGDQMTVAGEADLRVTQSLGGDLTMQGTYVVQSGSYNLTFAKVVKKEFTVRDGSSLVWSGDPANATLDMTAVYTVEEADLEPLTGQSVEGPANVLLLIDGTLESPGIAFDIEVPDIESLGPGVAQIVKGQVDEMQQNETQLYKNVFGLIVLDKFLPRGAGLAPGGGGGAEAAVNDQINSSVSQLLTSQLSQISEQYLGGVEIDVGLESNQGTGRDVDVAVSKDLFGDRLSVSVGGTSTSMGFAGEFEVLYRITEDGNLNLKAFQSTERNPLTNQLDEDAGVSLLYRNSFNEFFAGEQEEQTIKSREVEEKASPPANKSRTSSRHLRQ